MASEWCPSVDAWQLIGHLERRGIDGLQLDLSFEVLADQRLGDFDHVRRRLSVGPAPGTGLLGADGAAGAQQSRMPRSTPINRGRRCVPPYPGMIPRLTSGCPSISPRPTTRA